MATGQDPVPPLAPSGIFPAGFVGDLRVTDFDEMAAAARGWDQHYTKLGAGPFQGDLLQMHTRRMQLGTVRWSTGILSTGQVPRGARSFALAACADGPARIVGHPLRPDQIATRADSDELHFLTPGASELLVVSLSHDLIERTTATLFDMGWDAAGGASPILQLRDPAGAEGVLRSLIAAIGDEPAVLSDPARAEVVEEQAAYCLLSRLDLPPRRLGGAERRRLARRAEAFLRAHETRPVTVAELCAAVGVAERTLHDAFREHFGLPPIAYLRALRLNGAHRDLRTPCTSASVTDTATKWGFFHFGEFAGAYRRLFGELPSQTLRRGNATARAA